MEQMETPDQLLQQWAAQPAVTVDIRSLRTDPALQPRATACVSFARLGAVEAASADHIRCMAVQLKATAADPEPILIAKLPEGLFVVDGHHRLAACKQAGRTAIPARVLEVERRAAVLASKLVNYGGEKLRLHSDQRADAAWQTITDMTDRGRRKLPKGTSQRSLAARFGVSLGTINRMIERLGQQVIDPTAYDIEHLDPGTGWPRCGMTPQESIQALPTGATKGRRQDVALEVSKALGSYLRDNPDMPDGSPRPRQMQYLIQQEAIRLGVANPNATTADNLKVAERRALGSLIQVNGRWVPRGLARPGTERGIEAVTQATAKRLVERGVLTPEVAAGVYAAPLPSNPNVFAVMLPNGYPAADTTEAKGEVITFNPLEAAQLHHRFETEGAEARARAGQRVNQQLRQTPLPVSWGTADTPGALAQVANEQVAVYREHGTPLTDDGQEFPADFLQWVRGFKQKQRDAGRAQQ